jgi:hypothetical protein
MRTRTTLWLFVLTGLGLASPQASAQVPPRLTGELGVGIFLAGNDLGHTGRIPPVGHLRLGAIDALPALDVGALLPTTVFGTRPFVRFIYGPSSRVSAVWLPCEAWAACPSILIQPVTRVSRTLATAGLEIPVVRLGPSGVIHARVAAGVRRYALSWDAWGGATDSFNLIEGSYAESDALAQFGLGVTLPLGSIGITGYWSANVSSFGPGVLTAPDAATVDLGRARTATHVVGISARKAIF